MEASMYRLRPLVLSIALLHAFIFVSDPELVHAQPEASQGASKPLFRTADNCMACHNLLTAPSGEDASIGLDWRPTMMANAARDPYWQAGVQREVLDHPEAQEAIEGECSICHMPMTRYETRIHGGKGEIFAHLPVGEKDTEADVLAADGVSCTVCHQIESENLGKTESFVGHFVVDNTRPWGERSICGPFEGAEGRTTIMRSASRFRPTEASHIQSSELCATCHTLFTHALGPGGEVIGELPEQVPYLEWLHSDYRNEQSCQSCHMRELEGEMLISSVWGEARTGVSRHAFRGGNFFMPRIFNRYRAELGVEAYPQELSGSVLRTVEHLQSETAKLSVERAAVSNGRLKAEISIESLAGHKLPSAYPSRRAWLHFTVRDSDDRLIFDSGAFEDDGRIKGNDNDRDPASYEPHYREIVSADQVQIYEVIMLDREDRLTTGLLAAVRYGKDNRLLPRGFDKTTADEDIAVHGLAVKDESFTGGGDRIRYSVGLEGAEGPFRVDVELWYQPIGYRWVQNLRPYDTALTNRFVSYYESMSASSAIILARSAATAR
jgi:hypothetical protein